MNKFVVNIRHSDVLLKTKSDLFTEKKTILRVLGTGWRPKKNSVKITLKFYSYKNIMKDNEFAYY